MSDEYIKNKKNMKIWQQNIVNTQAETIWLTYCACCLNFISKTIMCMTKLYVLIWCVDMYHTGEPFDPPPL